MIKESQFFGMNERLESRTFYTNSGRDGGKLTSASWTLVEKSESDRNQKTKTGTTCTKR